MNRFLSWVTLVISVVILSYGINLPFAGQHDWNSAVYANIARNHLRYGLLTTKLGMVVNAGYTPLESFQYFTHYPPLMPLLIATSFAIFGIHEWSARLVPILSASLMIYYLAKLVQSLWNRTTALITAALLITSPMLFYYSKIPVHETVVLGFIGFTLWTYVNKRYGLTVIGLILSQATSWSGFYLSFYLPLHYWGHHRKILWKLFIVAPIMFILHNLHMYLLVGPKLVKDLTSVFLFRFNLGPTAKAFNVNTPAFLSRQAQWINLYFTRIVTLMAIFYLINTLLSLWRHRHLTYQQSFVILLGFFGFTHNLIFRNLAHIHDYMLIYSLPFFAISGAVVLTHLHKLLKKYLPLSSLIIAVLIFLIATERQAHLKTLFRPIFDSGVNLGKTLSSQTKFTDTIVVLSPQYWNLYEVFVRYYADRNVYAADTITQDLLSSVDYMVIPKSHNTVPVRDKQELYAEYPHVEAGDAIIFTITHP